jgi:DNA gyrase subunit B
MRAIVGNNDKSKLRTLRQVTIDSAAEADRIFSMLMGDEVPPRRDFIEKNAKYAKIDA